MTEIYPKSVQSGFYKARMVCPNFFWTRDDGRTDEQLVLMVLRKSLVKLMKEKAGWSIPVHMYAYVCVSACV